MDEEGNDIVVFHARTETEIVGDPLYNPKPNEDQQFIPLGMSVNIIDQLEIIHINIDTVNHRVQGKQLPSMPVRKRKLWGIRCTIRTVMPC